MKRILTLALCLASIVGMYAQKALIIHKTDGTKIEIPMKALNGFDFAGKAVVNDDDYTRIISTALHSGTELSMDIAAIFNFQDPYLQDRNNGRDFGVVYATSPDVDIETGTLLQMSADAIFSSPHNDTLYVSLSGENLEFETNYYFRSFIRRDFVCEGIDGEYFYSKVQCVNTGKPKMIYYGVDVDAKKYRKTGYVSVSTTALEAFIGSHAYLYGCKANTLVELWEEYLTPETIAKLIPSCTARYDCDECMLYILETIDEGFLDFIIDKCSVEVAMSGETEDYANCTDTVIVCKESWGVPGNAYWEYAGEGAASNPQLTYALSAFLLANHSYRLDIIVAPDVVKLENGLEIKPSKFYANCANWKTSENIIANNEECATYTYEFVTDKFAQAELVVRSNISSRERNKYDNTLRIVGIKLTPLGPIE